MEVYCTYFDRHYAARGLALYASLQQHCAPFRLYVLCLDAACRALLGRLGLPEVVPIALEEFERANPDVARCRADRSRVEYYFTCTPALIQHALVRSGALRVTYVDADLYFFADPGPLWVKANGAAVALTSHRYAPAFRGYEDLYGRYNVGWLAFGASPTATMCLAWWRAQCIAWCHDRVEDGKFADQKYLDELPARFGDVAILRHPGANLAPWNLGSHRVRIVDGTVTVDGAPLVFFHFHRLRQVLPWVYAPRLADFCTPLSPDVRRGIYVPYIRTVRRWHHRLRDAAPASAPGAFASLRGRKESISAPRPAQPSRWAVFEAARRSAEIGRRLWAHEYLFALGDAVW